MLTKQRRQFGFVLRGEDGGKRFDVKIATVQPPVSISTDESRMKVTSANTQHLQRARITADANASVARPTDVGPTGLSSWL